jgi:hypothetical protein
MENIMKLIKFFVAVVSVILSISVQANSETKQYTSESTKLLSQLQEQIRATLLAVSNNEKIAGKSMHDFHYLFSLPAQEITYLGLILELDNADNGYEVLSVTPGSTADKLAIKSRDHILKINDLTINNSTAESSLRLLNDLKPGDLLNLTVKSKKGERKLTTKLIGQFMPKISLEIGSDNKLAAIETASLNSNNMSSGVCGKVSVFFNPPAAKEIYPALFYKIDDGYLNKNKKSFKLPVGKHTISLHEYIDDKNFNRKGRGRGVRKDKSIEIDVKENTTYYIGAKFNRKNKLKRVEDEYWTPIVWKESNRECNL